MDLDTDIGETTDVAADHPRVVERLQEQAEACRQDIGDARLGVDGRNCRPVGRVEKPQTLTSLPADDPYLALVYD